MVPTGPCVLFEVVSVGCGIEVLFGISGFPGLVPALSAAAGRSALSPTALPALAADPLAVLFRPRSCSSGWSMPAHSVYSMVALWTQYPWSSGFDWGIGVCPGLWYWGSASQTSLFCPLHRVFVVYSHVPVGMVWPSVVSPAGAVLKVPP